MSKRTLAILAAIGATVIYGINHTVAKGVMPMHVKPFGFIFLRVGGATLLFWLISLFGPKEKIEKNTPILEAFTQNYLGQKYKLASVPFA